MHRLFPGSLKLFRAAFSLALVSGLALSGWRQASAQVPPLAAWPSEWQADSAFFNLWSRADAPVSSGAATRSWLWGPLPFAVANESYAESSTGERLVQYFDKARMEVNDPAADRAAQWFVTSGLLVTEMVTGKMQTGNGRFETRPPAAVPVAGDPTSPDAPTYAAFAGHTSPDSDATGAPVARLIGKDGTLSSYSAQTDPTLFNVTYYDAATQHNVPAVFANWMNQSGPVLEDGQFVQDQLVDPLFVLGHPITDAYWANVLVDGAPATVLVQLFERRALTYNPNNPPEWRVEMANVGRAYYDWRYKAAGPGPALAAETDTGGVAVRGWNWPAPSTVSVLVGPSGGSTLAGPSSATVDASGRFYLQLPYNKPLEDALQSGASLQLRASGGKAQAALPLAGKPLAGSVHIEGTVTFVETTKAGTRLTVTALDGKQWSLSLPAGAAITGSEGSPLAPSTLDAGQSAVVEAMVGQGDMTVSRIRLLSESRNGARVSYTWSADGTSIFVAGTSWPGERDVIFSTGPAGGAQTQFAKLTADSNGILSAGIQPPTAAPGQLPTWLFASSSDGSTLLAQVAVPLAAVGSAAVRPPIQLYITSGDGSQSAGTGPYCRQGKCLAPVGIALPVDALSAAPGALLGLRDATGTNLISLQSASGLSIQIYPDPGGGAQFVPGATPIFSSGDLPGVPFSVHLPDNLPSGRYVVLATVSWPDSDGGKNNGLYGFTVQVAPRGK
jgi:hypothetical protein